ncbi:hypothetical protein BC938DRAFT_476369, partial [Jimgerdemannia flammicorona]
MGELETDDNERPLYPPRIIDTEVLSNPFDDIVPRYTREERLAAEAASAEKAEAKKPKKKEKKNLALLSFGDEAPELEAPEFQGSKIKSSHDVLEDDPRLSKETVVKELLATNASEKATEVKDQFQEWGSNETHRGYLLTRLYLCVPSVPQNRSFSNASASARTGLDETRAAVERIAKRTYNEADGRDHDDDDVMYEGEDKGAALDFDRQMKDKVRKQHQALKNEEKGEEER